MEKKYIICDTAKSQWGKTETLLKVIDLLNRKFPEIYDSKYALTSEKTSGKDKWCHFEKSNKKVVISTLGDPYSFQPQWMKDAAITGAKVIVTACRTKRSTMNVVYNIARECGYHIIWFRNFHIANPAIIEDLSIKNVRTEEAKCIVNIIDSLLS